MSAADDYATQVELAQKLLKTVRHAAYATVNEDGSPHNSPLKLMHNERLTKLYIGSYSESLHVANLLRTGKAFVSIFDSFIKRQGGIYITCINARECLEGELTEALRIHNATRAREGSDVIEQGYYQLPTPSQRMYSLDIANIEIYSVKRGEDGRIESEARREVKPQLLLDAV